MQEKFTCRVGKDPPEMHKSKINANTLFQEHTTVYASFFAEKRMFFKQEKDSRREPDMEEFEKASIAKMVQEADEEQARKPVLLVAASELEYQPKDKKGRKRAGKLVPVQDMEEAGETATKGRSGLKVREREGSGEELMVSNGYSRNRQ